MRFPVLFFSPIDKTIPLSSVINCSKISIKNYASDEKFLPFEFRESVYSFFCIHLTCNPGPNLVLITIHNIQTDAVIFIDN